MTQKLWGHQEISACANSVHHPIAKKNEKNTRKCNKTSRFRQHTVMYRTLSFRIVIKLLSKKDRTASFLKMAVIAHGLTSCTQPCTLIGLPNLHRDQATWKRDIKQLTIMLCKHSAALFWKAAIWAFKLKCVPDGTAYWHTKACFCAIFERK